MKWLFLVVALAHADTCVQIGKPEFGQVEIVAEDFTGAALRDPRIELVEVGSKQSFDVAQPVPYGTYLMRIETPGFKLHRREIHLFQPHLIVRAELSISSGCAGPGSISGKIKQAPKGHELWVKLVPTVGIGGAESRVEPNGDFIIAGVDFGSYLLIVMDGNKAIHTETVVTTEKKSLTIVL